MRNPSHHLPLSTVLVPSMAISIVKACLVSLISLVLWRVVRPFIVKSTLSAIPGPQYSSWWKGMFEFTVYSTWYAPNNSILHSPGNFAQVFNRISGWEFHRDLLHKYGGVARLTMLFGVSRTRIVPGSCTESLRTSNYTLQTPWLYIISLSRINMYTKKLLCF